MKTVVSPVGLGTLLIAISALCFGSISVLTVLITAAGVPLVTAMAWRFILGAVLLGVVARVWQIVTVPRRRIIQLLLIGGCGQALITYTSLRALRYIPVGPLAFLFYTYPAWVALLAAVRGTERLTLHRVVALTLALLGVSIMVGTPTGTLHPIGVMLALGSAIIYSIYLPTLERVQQGVPILIATFLLIVGAATAFTLAALLTGQLYFPTAASVWTDIALLALVSTVVAFPALLRGVAILGPVRTSIVATVEPFFTALLGVLVLSTELSLTTVAGGALIALAVLLIHWSSARVEVMA